jgi:hypothetical protein
VSEVSPLEFLEAVFNNENLPLSVRMRAAIEAAPYRHSKLSTTANFHIDGTRSFAEALERAIARSRAPVPQPALIEHEPLPASELSKPFARLVRRF